MLLKHLRRPSATSTQLRLSLEYTQLDSGIDTPWYSATHDIPEILKYIEPTWATHTMQHLMDIKITLRDATLWTPQPLREHDICLMQFFLDQNLKKLPAINRCRLYLQIIYLSEIADGSGRFLTS